MEKPKDATYYKGYTQGYLDGYRDGTKDVQKGITKELKNNDILQLPIESMEITTRAYNCLVRLGCRYVSDLLQLSETNLHRARGMGSKTAAEIACWLDRNGFKHTVWSTYK